MNKVQGHGTLSWVAICVAFVFGLLLEANFTWGQDEMLPSPHEFDTFAGSEGSQYAGLEYDPHSFGPRQRRLGSAVPMHMGELPQEGEIIYEGEARFIGAEGNEVIPTPAEGEIIYEPGAEPHMDGMLHEAPCHSCGEADCSGCGTSDACASCGTWGGCGRDDCEQCIPLCLPRFRHLTLFGGVQGFKGPRDNGINSNFGFHEGITVSGRAPFFANGMAYQLGYRATQTRLHGDATSQDGRVQHFFTGGLFRRSQVGLQYGAAYDFLRDDLTEEIDFSQMRAEISILGPRGGEVGFLGMFHLNNEGTTAGATTTPLEPIDQYLLFIRRQFANCGEGRLWGGFSDDDEGIFGGEFLVPLDDRWSLAGGFNYLIPQDDAAPQGAIQEAWNVGISLVWHWNCDAKTSHNSPFRPLFNVADNGTMIIDRP